MPFCTFIVYHMTHKLVLEAGDWRARTSVTVHHPWRPPSSKHCTKPYGSSCVPDPFGLNLAGPHGLMPNHQMLTSFPRGNDWASLKDRIRGSAIWGECRLRLPHLPQKESVDMVHLTSFWMPPRWDFCRHVLGKIMSRRAWGQFVVPPDDLEDSEISLCFSA